MNLWQKIKKEKEEHNPNEPILVSAPMADVTDVAFRFVIAKYGKPDAIWTEFVSADGLILAPNDNPDEKGFTSRDKLMADLKFCDAEKPIVVQIFSSNPANIRKVSEMLCEMGFDGIDINMGCPDRSIERQKSGSAMIKNPKLAQRVILAAKDGVGYVNSPWLLFYKICRFLRLGFLSGILVFKIQTKIPISVKTRLGYNRDELENWLPKILATFPSLVTIHARTRKQMSKSAANWDRIKKAVEIRDDYFKKHARCKKLNPLERTLIFGNGDVKNTNEAILARQGTGCDGVMIGRGLFGNPWLFGQRKADDIPIRERLSVMLEQSKKFTQELPHKNFSVMKKHYKAYVEGFDGAKELRNTLMETNNYEEAAQVVHDFLKKLN